MKTLVSTKTLANGVTIPVVGFGTWQIPNEEAYDAVMKALKAGYRHIDTAAAYRNEENVGKAIRESGIPRNEIFVTSKLPAQIKGYQETLDQFEKTMQALGLDALDLYLIHAPWPWNEMGKDCTQGNIDSWKAMEKLYQDGRIRSIGISNFDPQHIQPLLDSCTIVPHANQIPFWIGHTKKETVAFCDKHAIAIESASTSGGAVIKVLGAGNLAYSAPKTASYETYQTGKVGEVELTKGQKVTLRLQPVAEGWAPVNVRKVTLTPQP